MVKRHTKGQQVRRMFLRVRLGNVKKKKNRETEFVLGKAVSSLKLQIEGNNSRKR
jgi:phage anti-repressor protein